MVFLDPVLGCDGGLEHFRRVDAHEIAGNEADCAIEAAEVAQE